MLEGRNAYRCKRCRSEGVTARRRAVVDTIKLEHGGACTECGYDRCLQALDFHHKNPADKLFGVSCGNTRGINILREEAKKCVLLCANCHREVEAGALILGGEMVAAPDC